MSAKTIRNSSCTPPCRETFTPEEIGHLRQRAIKGERIETECSIINPEYHEMLFTNRGPKHFKEGDVVNFRGTFDFQYPIPKTSNILYKGTVLKKAKKQVRVCFTNWRGEVIEAWEQPEYMEIPGEKTFYADKNNYRWSAKNTDEKLSEITNMDTLTLTVYALGKANAPFEVNDAANVELEKRGISPQKFFDDHQRRMNELRKHK